MFKALLMNVINCAVNICALQQHNRLSSFSESDARDRALLLLQDLPHTDNDDFVCGEMLVDTASLCMFKLQLFGG